MICIQKIFQSLSSGAFLSTCTCFEDEDEDNPGFLSEYFEEIALKNLERPAPDVDLDGIDPSDIPLEILLDRFPNETALRRFIGTLNYYQN